MAYQEALPESCMAAVVAEFNQPVELRELPVPELQHGALLVKIEAATVCGTDLHIWDGAFGAGGIGQVNLPIVPGHEMVGRVAAFGPGEHADVTGSELKIGDRIVFTPGRCGSCHYCTVAGQPNLCTKRIGYGRQSAAYPYLVGGFAEYCYVYPTSSRIRVPDEVKPEWASAASCALRSVITGFRQLGAIEPWQTVVVQGSGPLGLFATAMAKRAGAARIIVIGDPSARLEVARAWGATETIPVSSHGEPEERVTAVRETTAGQGAEIVMEFSGARTAFPEGIAMVRRGGRYLVGGQVGPQEVPFRPTLITQNQLTITGSYSGSEAEYWRAIEFIRRAKNEYDFDQILSSRFRLDQVTDAFHGMQSMQEIKPVVIPEFA
jgi:threonine dehydrogenase-like Zn-dependent dehydrogenase